MSKIIKIDPVTRIEGHAEIKLFLDENDKCVDSQVKVVEFRGFEKFLIGRPVEEMPLITPRMCGICHTPHHICSAKAVDGAFGLKPHDIPPMITAGTMQTYIAFLYLFQKRLGPDIFF